MKKKSALVAAMALVLMTGASLAYADSYYWHVSSNDGDDNPIVTDVFPNDKFEFLAHRGGSARTPEFWSFDTSFTQNTGTKTVGIGNISQDNVDGLTALLTSINSSLSSHGSSITSINNSINYLNSYTSALVSSSTYQLERTRVQTNGSGTYTWTFPQAFASGTLPIISAIAEDSSSNAMTNVQVTALSNTSVTIATNRISPILGVLSLTSYPQVYVHLTAMKP